MRINQQIITCLLMIIFLGACRGGISEAVLKPPTPEPGKASVQGRVISGLTDEPMGETIVRLAEVVRQGDRGAYVLDGAFSPGDITDENGVFLIENVEAMEYVIVVGDVESIYEVIPDDSGKPKVWNAVVDEVLLVGDLVVDIGN